MAGTILRVKRSLEVEPSETLILECKRRKLVNDPKGSTTALLTFAGTIEKDEDVLNHLKKTNALNAKELKDQFKKRQVNISQKLRDKHKENIKNDRFKVVNSFRSIEDDEIKSEDSPKNEVIIYDLEADGAESQNKTEAEKFVYDVYTCSDDFGELELEDYINMHPLLDHSYAKMEHEDESDSAESEDSNAENCWRNDYPDEEDGLSIDEDDMINAVKKLNCDDDLSSDGEDIDGDDVDPKDRVLYGEKYAKFKARQEKMLESCEVVENDLHYDEEDEYYY